MRYINTIAIIILLLVIMFAPPIAIRGILAKQNQLQQDMQQLRQEMERMQQEPSRGGSRRMMEITYYTTAADECGKDDGITASGKVATVGRTIAAGTGLPFGTKVYIPGIGERVVEDRGGAIDNSRIDVLVEDKATAYRLGRHMAQVVIER